MKHTLLFIILTAVSLLSACSQGEILALKVEGTWKCAKLELNTPINHNIHKLICDGKLTFVKNEDENGGTVTIETNVKTYSFSTVYNTRVVANGAWTAYGSDEILLIFESEDIHISPVSPANTSVSQQLDIYDAIKQGFKDLSHISYIDIKDGFMKCQISYSKVVMMKK